MRKIRPDVTNAALAAKPHLRLPIGPVGGTPAGAHLALHTHSVKRLRVSLARLDGLLAIAVQPHQLRGGRIADPLRRDGERDEHDSARQHGGAEPGMQKEKDTNEEEHPWKIDQRGRPAPAEELANLIDVAHRLT